MFDLGWTEMMVIAVVALIVVGPKDLPGMFKAVGNFIGKAKRMAREFSQAMNDAADQAGVGDVKKTFDAATNPMKAAANEVKKSTESFTQQTMNSGKPKLSPERQEAADKIRAKSAESALERQAKEKAEAEAAAPKDVKPKEVETSKAATKKTPAKKAAAKKATAKTAKADTPTKTAAKPKKPKAPAKTTAKSTGDKA